MSRFLLVLRIALFLMLVMLFFPVYAADYGEHQAEVVSIHDGDTLTVSVPEWPEVIRIIPVRVSGIDTPELNGKCHEEKAKALEARAFVGRLVSDGRLVTLRNIGRDKYFRILASVYVGEKSLADELLKAGLAKPYDGGEKQGWCHND